MSYNFPGTNLFPLSVTLPDDASTPNQANFSPGWEGSLNRTVNLSIRNLGSVYFPAQLSIFNGFTINCAPQWDLTNSRMLIGVQTGKVYTTYDGVVWYAVGGTLTATPTAVAAAPIGGAAIAAKGSNGSMAYLVPATDTWVEYSGPPLNGSGKQDAVYSTALNTFFLWESQPSAQMRIYLGTTGSGSAFGSNLGGSFPAGFLHNGATQYKMFTAQNSGRMLFATSRPGFTQYVYTDNGITFTAAAMPVTMTGSMTVTGIAYDAFHQVFVMMVATTGGVGVGNTQLFTSTTGVAGTWSAMSYTYPLPLSQGLTALNSSGACMLVSQLWVRQLIWRGPSRGRLFSWKLTVQFDSAAGCAGCLGRVLRYR